MKCGVHLNTTLELTNWEPPQGIDPKLRQFECPVCHRFVYKVPTGFESAQKGENKGGQNEARHHLG